MCSPAVMLKVHQEISRRRLLGQTGAAAAVAAVGAGTLAVRSAAAQEATPVASPVAGDLPGGFSQIVDLTHAWGEDFPVFPGTPEPTFETAVTIAENGYYSLNLTLNEHTGTHMDAPAHFADGGATAERIPVEQLIAPLAVIDISERAASDPDAEGTVDDITAWEEANGPLPTGAFVALYSGWEARLDDPASYVNQDDEDVQHYPGWAPEAAAFLVEEREIVGIGVDTLSLDYGASTDFGTHVTLLNAGRYGLENLANLGDVPAAGATIVVGGPKHTEASGGPTRAFALI